jgi:hypothetical protein
MTASLVTLVLLGCMLLWLRAWQRRSRMAVGVAAGAAVALLVWPVVVALGRTQHMPVWVPALPFALIAISLFGFGLLAWFWSED